MMPCEVVLGCCVKSVALVKISVDLVFASKRLIPSEGLEYIEGDVVQDAERAEGGQFYGEIERYETTARKIREWKQ